MDGGWWQLPGPARFVQAVVHDLRDGKNVVLALPAHAPAGLREVVAERVRANDLWRWRPVDAGELPGDRAARLAAALHRALVPRAPAEELGTALDLARRLVGHVVWVDAAGPAAWPAWAAFLAEYQHACQGGDPADRSLFCLPVVGAVAPPPAADVALSVRRWEGAVGRLDVTLYLDRPLAARFPHPLHRRAAQAVIAELAGSDEALARHLAAADLATIMDPFDALCQFAADRGWGPEVGEVGRWADGTSDTVDGRPLLHAAAAAAAGHRAEIRRRVWRGQVTVLYPFVEEQRVGLIPQIRGYLRLPVETTYGRVDDPEQLEVGQLLYFLRGKNLPPRLWRLLALLTEMRHALAHLEPVPARTLLADEVVRGDGAGD